jgi:hypothetical protein
MSTSLNMLETMGLQTRSLLAEAEEIFPPLNPNPTDSIEQIMYRAGQRSVVEWLTQQLEN